METALISFLKHGDDMFKSSFYYILDGEGLPTNKAHLNLCHAHLSGLDTLSMFPTKHARHGLQSCSCLLVAPSGNFNLASVRSMPKLQIKIEEVEQRANTHKLCCGYSCRLLFAVWQVGAHEELYINDWRATATCCGSWSWPLSMPTHRGFTYTVGPLIVRTK